MVYEIVIPTLEELSQRTIKNHKNAYAPCCCTLPRLKKGLAVDCWWKFGEPYSADYLAIWWEKKVIPWSRFVGLFDVIVALLFRLRGLRISNPSIASCNLRHGASMKILLRFHEDSLRFYETRIWTWKIFSVAAPDWDVWECQQATLSGVYRELLSASIRRCTLSTSQDPFQADAELICLWLAALDVFFLENVTICVTKSDLHQYWPVWFIFAVLRNGYVSGYHRRNVSVNCWGAKWPTNAQHSPSL